ncbi:MAG: hypothetical protein IIA55_11385 [Gemmatimonadetes bacterium]|nr:hypothetical protein [Gemmatimonadota bacterium]
MPEIRTGDDFKDVFPGLGILPSHALAAVRQPATQQLIAIDDAAIMGLYLAQDTHVHSAFMLSIVSIPSSHLTAGFRFYDDIHPDPTAVELIEILKLIVDRFGVEFALFGRRTKFLLRDRISLRKKPSGVGFTAPKGFIGTAQMFFRIDETNNREFPFAATCALCFMIDTDKYGAYLQGH